MIRLDEATRETLAIEERRYSNLMQAIGDSDGAKQARILNGETVPQYRARLASKLQHLDPQWKGSNLHSVAAMGSDPGGQVLLDQAVRSIYDSAEHTLRHNSAAILGAGVLRAASTTNELGQRFTRFYGDPMAWMSTFMGGAARVGRINLNPPSIKPSTFE